MKPSTQDKAGGTIDELKGQVKETAGRLTSSPDLQNEGQAQKVAGKMEHKVGEIEQVFEK